MSKKLKFLMVVAWAWYGLHVAVLSTQFRFSESCIIVAFCVMGLVLGVSTGAWVAHTSMVRWVEKIIKEEIEKRENNNGSF